MLGAQQYQHKKQVGLYLADDGIAIAEIDSSVDAAAVQIKSCDFLASTDAAEQLKLLTRYVREHNLKNRPCVMVLDDAQYNLFQMPVPAVEDSELKSALRWNISDLLSYPVDEAVIDVFRVPVQQHREAKAYVVAAHREHVEQAIGFVKKSGMILSTIDIEELSLGNIIEQFESQERGVAVLHFGREHGSINLYSNSDLYLSRKIDTGLNRIEEMLSIGAEAQVYESIILELQRSLDFYESEYARAPISKIIVAPRQPILQGICDYISSNAGLSIELINLAQVFSTATDLNDENQAKCLLALAAASRKAAVHS